MPTRGPLPCRRDRLVRALAAEPLHQPRGRHRLPGRRQVFHRRDVINIERTYYDDFHILAVHSVLRELLHSSFFLLAFTYTAADWRVQPVLPSRAGFGPR